MLKRTLRKKTSWSKFQKNKYMKITILFIVFAVVGIILLISIVVFFRPKEIRCGVYDGACYTDRCIGRLLMDDGTVEWGIKTACHGVCYGYKYNKCEKSYVPISILKNINIFRNYASKQ